MDKQKADVIINEYIKKIYGFAVKKSFSYDEAEELAQEIVKEVYLSLRAADEIPNPDGYVWRISEHVYSKYVASKKRHEGVSIDGLALPFYDEYSFENSDEDILRLRREIAFLSEKRREIVYLFYYENRSISYIAKKTSLSEGTVKWHLNKARNELKEGFNMERRIGKLGLNPVKYTGMGHGGSPANGKGPEYYIGNKLEMNICYSVYFEPKTKEEIAEELGITPVYIEDKIDFLEQNGFLVPTSGGKYTTYVCFCPETYSLEAIEARQKKQLEAALMLAEKYVPMVREAIKDMTEVYIPGGNRELFEAAAIFYAINNKCRIESGIDISKYKIKTTHGSNYFVYVDLEQTRTDPEYKPTLEDRNYWTCGDMTRKSDKYPVYSWSVDTKFCTRKGAWQNNLTEDYEYLYEVISGAIKDDAVNAEKFKRLRERNFLTEDGKPNIMVVKGTWKEFADKLPALPEEYKQEFAKFAIESAMIEAKKYPAHMQDLIVATEIEGFMTNITSIMTLDVLYSANVFKPLTKEEGTTATLLMFCDILPTE